MSDRIAVMNRGRIEQLGPPSELYESPRTTFVAGFLGVSNLLAGTVSGPGLVQLDGAGEVRVPASRLPASGRVSVGVRPEKIALGDGEANVLGGTVTDRAYVGVATQYVVETPAGALTVYVQNSSPGGAASAEPGSPLTLSFNPEATFVVDASQEGSPA